MRFDCPTCKRSCEGTPTLAEFPTLPFCSARCRAADLGSWLNGTYRIGSPISEEDLDAGLPVEGGATPPPDET
ncbi:MAG: yacG [Myxococcales bacterium]|nr:yacG [Myxococcales bacterium]